MKKKIEPSIEGHGTLTNLSDTIVYNPGNLWRMNFQSKSLDQESIDGELEANRESNNTLTKGRNKDKKVSKNGQSDSHEDS